MTNEQINITIAELCGWTEISHYTQAVDGWYGYEPEDGPHSQVPDYCNDLNAMHEAEKTLIFSERRLFRHWLQKVKSYDLGDDVIIAIDECVHATAKQRAEAFLRTIGKWEE